MFITCTFRTSAATESPSWLALACSLRCWGAWSVYRMPPVCMPGVGEKLQTGVLGLSRKPRMLRKADCHSQVSCTATTRETVGTLDLGGASTQITFLPQFEVSQIHTRITVYQPAWQVTGARRGPFQTAAPPWAGWVVSITDWLNLLSLFQSPLIPQALLRWAV